MTKNNTGPNIEIEKKTVNYMISLYCHKKHTSPKNQLCDVCRDMLQYALSRLNYCRYGEEKTTCEKCPTHCYRKDYREKVKSIMRYSGPRMILYHPIMAVNHLVKNLKNHNKK